MKSISKQKLEIVNITKSAETKKNPKTCGMFVDFSNNKRVLNSMDSDNFCFNSSRSYRMQQCLKNKIKSSSSCSVNDEFIATFLSYVRINSVSLLLPRVFFILRSLNNSAPLPPAGL